MSDVESSSDTDYNDVSALHDFDASAENSDSSPLDEVADHEFPLYFIERGGRLFHSHPTSPYPLPVDTPEQERLTVQHNTLNRIVGANYVGPVPMILAFHPEQERKALDLCTGNGKWVLDMAQQFPHVHFIGLDIVPIATRYPPSNVQFEIHDVNTQTRWAASTFDLVHARSATMAILDFEALTNEVARILRPGGLFVSCEWGRIASFHPNSDLDIAEHAPASVRFFEVLNQVLADFRGLHIIPSQISGILANSDRFTDVTSHRFYVPIGGWHRDPDLRRLGKAFRIVQMRFANSVKPLLLDSGLAVTEVVQLLSDYVEELSSTDGLVSVYFTTHARCA